MRALLPDAHALALSTGVTVYDATYLTLAVRLETEIITGDDRFARRLADHPLLAAHVRSLRARATITLSTWPPIHPASLRCSSVECTRHSPFSRLARAGASTPKLTDLLLREP